MSKKADKFIDKYIVGKNDWLLKNKEVISKLLDEYEAEQLTIPVVIVAKRTLCVCAEVHGTARNSENELVCKDCYEPLIA
tara:strand:- start:237 stop:476 length:240 start_codon:yes stop_codon:yes gene_type:complete